MVIIGRRVVLVCVVWCTYGLLRSIQGFVSLRYISPYLPYARLNAQSNVPILTDLDELDNIKPRAADEKGSGLAKYLEDASRIIGKTPGIVLQDYVHKQSLPALGLSTSSDFDELAAMALDLAWKKSNGDWDVMLNTLNKDLGPACAKADEALKKTVEILDTLTEKDLKTLIRNYSDSGINALPKFNREKWSGKFVKADYIAQLVDVVRVKCFNDYVKVAEILDKEGKKASGFKK